MSQNVTQADQPEIKKRKIEENHEINGKNNDKNNPNPRLFRPQQVLKNGRFACVQGNLNGETSLLLLQQKEFSSTDLLSNAYSSDELEYEKLFHNDVYSKYVLYPKSPYNGIQASLISPCTQKHIDKYRQQRTYIVEETPEYYKNITLQHLLHDQFDLQWVYNILSGEKEADRVIYKDKENDENGFILLPDLHWDGKNSNNLHLLALPFKHGILSIRDLNSTHLPLLNHIYKKSIEVIEEKYGLAAECLRMYFHYQPTFYHLHVHITYIQHEAPGIFVEKSHLLRTVINNIELISDYYQKATLSFTIRETDTIFTKYLNAGILKKIITAPQEAKDSNT